MRTLVAYGVAGGPFVAILIVTGGAFYGLISLGEQGFSLALLGDTYLRSILGFSLKQAALSALLAVLLAWPVARALYYVPSLVGRRLFLALCLLCFVLPTLVLITGLVALLGRSGWLTPWLGESWNLYGLHGILLAHVFLNLPFAVRALFLQLQGIPDSSWQLAQQLKLSGWQCFILIEWPMVRGRLWVLAGFVFVLCFNSFAVVLALGGGPQSTTLEVAIYQALKYDFNMAEALTLAWVQFAIAGSLLWLMTRLGSVVWLSADTATRRWVPVSSLWARVLHRCVYALAWVMLSLPLLALLPGVYRMDAGKLAHFSILRPTLVTLGLGSWCAVSAVVLAYALLYAVRQARMAGQPRRQWLLEWLATHTLVAPAMVLSVGWYILLLQQADLESWGMLMVWILNTALIIPFAVQQLRPRLFLFDDQYAALCLSLKLTFRQRLQVEWPWLQASLRSASVLVLLLAMGDVAIFSILGSDEWMTLPWLIYSYAGTYRLAEASLVSLVLLVLCGLIVGWLEQEQVHHHA